MLISSGYVEWVWRVCVRLILSLIKYCFAFFPKIKASLWFNLFYNKAQLPDLGEESIICLLFVKV